MAEAYLESMYEYDKAYLEFKRCASIYEPMSAVERFFEDGEQSNNAVTPEKTKNALKKAIDALLKFINNIIESVTDTITRLFMSKEEKEKLEQFKKLIQSNPEYANVKLRVKDVNKIKEAYTAALKEVDNAIDAIQTGRMEASEENKKKVMSKVDNILKAGAKTATTVVGAQTLLRSVEGNKEVARFIKSRLENEKGLVSKFIDGLGEKESSKFKKMVDKNASVLPFHRWKVRILGQYNKDFEHALNSTYKEFADLLKRPESLLDGVSKIKHHELVGRAIGATNKNFGTDIKTRDFIDGGIGVAKLGMKIKKTKDTAHKLGDFLTG